MTLWKVAAGGVRLTGELSPPVHPAAYALATATPVPDQAYRLGMVSKIFAANELADKTLDFARRIAQLPTMAALLIKESVNQSMDNMGFYNALHASFTIHQLNHSHWAEVRSDGVGRARPEDGVPGWPAAAPVVPAVKNEVRAQT